MEEVINEGINETEIYNNLKILDSFLQYHTFQSQEEADEFADAIKALYTDK